MRLIYRLLFIKEKLFFLQVASKYNKFLILDIDNTLCNSRDLSLNTDYANVVAYYGTRDFSKNFERYIDLMASKGYKVIFLSHRHVIYKSITEKWLSKNLQFTKNFRLFLVRDPIVKIWYLRRLYKSKVVYWDDLSSSEDGEIVLYTNIMDQVASMKHVKYYGLKEIINFENNS